MKTYSELIEGLNESSLVIGSSIIYVSKIKTLSDKIKREKSPVKKLELIGLQNRYISLMNGINTSLISKEIKSLNKRK